VTTTIFVCGDQPRVTHDAPDLVVVDGLCQDPHQMKALPLDADRVVLVLHEKSYDLPDVQKALRSIDVDPLGARSRLSIRAKRTRERKAAVSGVCQPSGVPSAPHSHVHRGASRRSRHVRRRRWLSCLCGRLPPERVSVAGRSRTCMPCGQCVTTCPTGAIENPAITSAMLDAQVRALLDQVYEPTGIRFVCSRGSIEPRDGWSDVSVPCTSMVPGSWLLACLLIGAQGATAVPCGESRCPLELDVGAIQANDLAHTVLSEAGLEPGMVTGDAIHDPILFDGFEDPFGRDRAPDVMLAIAQVAQREINVVHPASHALCVANVQRHVRPMPSLRPTRETSCRSRSMRARA